MYFSHNEKRVKEKNQHGRMKRKKKTVLILRYEAFFFTGADSQRVYFFSLLTINHSSPSYIKTVFILAQTATDVARKVYSL